MFFLLQNAIDSSQPPIESILKVRIQLFSQDKNVHVISAMLIRVTLFVVVGDEVSTDAVVSDSCDAEEGIGEQIHLQPLHK